MKPTLLFPTGPGVARSGLDTRLKNICMHLIHSRRILVGYAGQACVPSFINASEARGQYFNFANARAKPHALYSSFLAPPSRVGRSTP
jgi:hypothetical protein